MIAQQTCQQSTDDSNMVLASAIHEIKNQFNLLLIEIDKLTAQLPDDSVSDQQKQFVNAQTLFVANQLSQILSIYKANTQSITLHIEQHDIADFLDEIAQRHQRNANVYNTTIEVNCDPCLDGYFDHFLIQLIFDTAILNAIREPNVSEILLHATNEDNALVLRIEDNGSGFPEEILQHRIEPATAAPHSMQNGQFGLGLAFANQIARLHRQDQRHGAVTLSNHHLLPGACLSIILP